MSHIKISDFSDKAFSANEGQQLREKINQVFDNHEDVVEVDFEGITVFATMFFNNSIGYFVKKLSPDECERRIILLNLSELGDNTYRHSFDINKTAYNTPVEINDELIKMVETVVTSNL